MRPNAVHALAKVSFLLDWCCEHWMLHSPYLMTQNENLQTSAERFFTCEVIDSTHLR